MNRLKVDVYQKILKLDKIYELNDDDLLKMADKTIEIICNNKAFNHDNKLYIYIHLAFRF